MLFQNKMQKNMLLLALTYLISSLSITTTYAANHNTSLPPVSADYVMDKVNQSDLDGSFQISVTPEVVKEINRIRHDETERQLMLSALQRMQQYKPRLQSAFKTNEIPDDMLALPLIESGYQPLKESKNALHAAGIWQVIPSTGKEYGLVINKKRDDRLNTDLATKAAIAYLKSIHNNYRDWNLAVISYAVGNDKTNQLLKNTNSHDVWELARSPLANKELNRYITRFTTAVILMHNPSLLNS